MEAKDYFILIGIFIAASFTAYQYYDGVMSGKKNEELTNQLLKKTTELADANRENGELQKQINEKANEIIISNTKLINIQSKTIKSIIGDGHAIVELDYISNDGIAFIIKNQTEYPLIDLSVTLRDINELVKHVLKIDEERVTIKGKELIESEITQLAGENLGGSQMMQLPIKVPLNKETKYLQFKIMCKHAVMMQYTIITYDPVTKLFKTSYRLSKLNYEKKLFDELIAEGGDKFSEEIWEQKLLYKKKVSGYESIIKK